MMTRTITYSLIAFLFTAPELVGASDDIEFFEKKIRPVLVQHCYECHSAAADKPKGGLRLDWRGATRKGGESGPAVVSGKPEKSLLLEAIRHESFEMPPSRKLPQPVIADFEKWIRMGAADPRDKAPSITEAAASTWKAQLAERSQWWSLQPLKTVSPPPVKDTLWSKEPVDRFIRSALEQAKLPPAKSADPETLLRRLSFVLTGLPPAPQQRETFRKAMKANPDFALEKLVEELLASPHFGERFARHWMDVVRYTDTYGYEWDNPAKGSWEYRDYLIRAFNDDVGFDQLIREQIAGDLLPHPRINKQANLNESLIGPMFYHMGEHRHGNSLQFNGIHQEMINNKIDAFSKSFLAMTVACARCHDHKLDAISQADYYALAGIFMTPRWTARSIDTTWKNDAAIAELKRLRSEIHKQTGTLWSTKTGPLASGATLQKWAYQNQSSLKNAKRGDIAWLFANLLNNTETTWLESKNIAAKSTGRSTDLVVGADNSILAQGELTNTDTYTVKFTTDPGNVSLLRLEALTHDSLGNRGPGRTAHGNFVLSHLRVEVKPFSAPGAPASPVRKINLVSARADYSQLNHPVEDVLDPAANKGWGVGLGGNVDRTAWFTFDGPVELPHGGEWTVILEQNYGSQHVLGRFRLMPGLETKSIRSHQNISETWRRIVTEWRSTHEARKKNNADNFTYMNDFQEPGFPEGWSVEGEGIKHGYVTNGMPLISLTGDTLIDQLLPRGYHTHALSSKLAGAVRLPAQNVLPENFVSLQVRGGEWAGHILVPQNAFQNEPLKFYDPAAPLNWTSIADQGLKNGVTRVFLELVTSSLHPNFPPRTGIARAGKVILASQDDGLNKRSWFSLTGIAFHKAGGTPADTLETIRPLLTDEPATTSQDAWQRITEWFAGGIGRWASNKATPEDVKMINWLLKQNLLPNQAKETSEIAALVNQYREVEARIEFPRSVISMDERGVTPLNYRLNIRGNVDEDGPPIPRDFLEVFAGKHNVAKRKGSGRLELAEYLSSRENPQTARVYVNRIWQSVFGKGIVATPNDFGKLGDRPSHPELLDWLATQFMKDGWSTKKLVRRLVLSQTFRQSGTVTQSALNQDPGNRLLHHYPTRRLEAEAIRDNILAVSGKLDRQLYGPPVNPPRLVEDAAKRLFSGPLDSNGRRSIYMKMSIMDPPKLLVCFNLPDLKLPTGHRDVSNGPTQALALLNDPFFVSLGEYWAERMVQDGLQTPEERVRSLFIQALGRTPRSIELRRWTNAVSSFSKSNELMTDKPAWAELAHLLFNTKEFIYYR